ncbi:MAG: hypothetical protein NVSMB62_17130 [Acidobacteriaceae bacterium]
MDADKAGRRFRALAGAVISGFVVFIVLVWPVLLGHLRAAILLDRLSGQRVIRLQRIVAGPVSVSVVQIPSATQPISGHLFKRARDSGGRGIVIVHGFSPIGDSYGELASAADNLAAGGFVVLTPTIPPLTHYLVTDEGMRMIGDSAVWLAKETGQPVTVIAISFSGGLALVTAIQPEYRNSFRQVICLAPYDDLRRITIFYLTGKEARPDGQEAPNEASDPFALDVTALHFLEWLVPAPDVAPIGAVLQRSLMLRQTQSQNPHLMDSLTPAQQQEAKDILAAPENLKVRLMDATIAQGASLSALSPHGQMASLTVPVTVITGLNDPAIPTMETEWLAQDLPKRAVCMVYLTPLIQHVSLSTHGQQTGLTRVRHWIDKLRLLHALAPAMEGADPHRLFPGCSM